MEKGERIDVMIFPDPCTPVKAGSRGTVTGLECADGVPRFDDVSRADERCDGFIGCPQAAVVD